VASEDHTRLQIGFVLGGRYRITGVVGAGGMGTVYSAQHLRIGREVAVKVLRRDLSARTDMMQRFSAEARAAAALSHPNIVDVMDFDRDGDLSFMVMERLVGEELQSRIQRQGRLDPALVAEIGSATADAIGVAHAHGIIHRDLKPQNIFLADKGRQRDVVKILDFGIAKLAERDFDQSLTRSGEITGTPLYMSPEQMRSSKDVDSRTDIYSIGVILFQALTGRLPFDGVSFPALVLAISTGSPPLVRTLRPDVPPGLAATVERAMARDKERRFSSAADLRDALLPFVRGGASVEPATAHSHVPMRSGQTASVRPASVPVIRSQAVAIPADTRSIRQTIQATVPSSMKTVVPDLAALFEHGFRKASKVSASIVRLDESQMADTDEIEFFAIFSEGPMDGNLGRELGKSTFAAQSAPLELHLARLDRSARKVVFFIADLVDFGEGALEKILDLQARYAATVLPLSLAEVSERRKQGRLGSLIMDRWGEFQARPDVYADTGATKDRWRFFGMAQARTDLVDALRTKGRVVSLVGLPGSGKSSLVNMAESSMLRGRFIRIQCATHEPRTFESLSVAVQKNLGSSDASGLPDGPVLVLEDADWAIAGLRDSQSVERQAEARRFWTALCDRVRKGELRVLVTSMGLARLSGRWIAGEDNAIDALVRDISVPMISLGDTGKLVRGLGLLIGVRYAPRAIEEIHRWTSGHVLVIKRLCSTVLSGKQAERDSRSQMTITVTTADVRNAARALIADNNFFGQTYTDAFSDLDRSILRAIAIGRHGSVQELQSDLPTVSPHEVQQGMRRLERAGLVRPNRLGRYVVPILALAHWARSNLLSNIALDRRAQRVRRRRLVLGASMTAVLALAYVGVSRSETAPMEVSDGAGCIYSIQYPRRIDKEQEALITLTTAGCGTGNERFHLLPTNGTILRLAGKLVPVAPFAMDCLLGQCSGELKLSTSPGHFHRSTLAVIAGSKRVMDLTIGRDEWTSVPGAIMWALKRLSAVPLTIGLFLAFHHDLLKVLGRAARTIAGRGGRNSPMSLPGDPD
jgi:serine/threonine protein kinase